LDVLLLLLKDSQVMLDHLLCDSSEPQGRCSQCSCNAPCCSLHGMAKHSTLL
jgi:hypothetical protein